MLSTLSTAGNALHDAVSRSLTDFVPEIKAGLWAAVRRPLGDQRPR